jgi:hypothetical protein
MGSPKIQEWVDQPKDDQHFPAIAPKKTRRTLFEKKTPTLKLSYKP